MPRKGRRASRRNKSSHSGSSADSQIVQFARATGAATTVIREDLKQRPQNFSLVQHPPKNWLTMTYWTKLMYDLTITTNTSTQVETNIYFTLNNFSGYSSIVSAFDQYAIYAITVSLSLASNATSYTTPAGIYTAIDYDNTTTIGKQGIQALSSCAFGVISQDDSIVRTLRPCIAPVVNNTASAFNGNSVARGWCDAGYVNIPHYGFRILPLVRRV